MFDSRFHFDESTWNKYVVYIQFSIKLSKFLFQKFWKFLDGVARVIIAQSSFSWSVFYGLVTTDTSMNNGKNLKQF